MILLKEFNKTPLTGIQLRNYRRKKRILNLLYHHETLSGSVISKKISVSFPTAVTLLKELQNSDFIESRGTGISKGGRKPVLFGLSNNSIFVVACELGRYEARLTIYNSHNEAVSPVEKFETNIDDKKLVDKIFSNAQKLIKRSKINDDRIFGIGVTMPGLIDENKGINYTIKNPDFRNVKERLEEKFSKLIYVNNDARMQAYGEYRFGAAIGHENAVIINWNWGIGFGMILDGKLYSGATGFAGELSHIRFDSDGELCICGKRGCLETVTSVASLLKNARKGIEQGTISQLTKKFKGKTDKLTADDVISAARNGDEYSISLLYNLGVSLGEGLSIVIQLINPDIIVLGGTMTRANQYVLAPIQQSLNMYCLEQISENVKIVISDSWEQSGLLGVTAVMFQKLFSDMIK
jgi:predicted NBD/HSP70 family sugar kinase